MYQLHKLRKIFQLKEQDEVGYVSKEALWELIFEWLFAWQVKESC